MEEHRVEKRPMFDDPDTKILEPVLVRIDKQGAAPHDIRIDKSEFKIGRAKDNDEIILDPTISRRHCIIECEGNDKWVLKDQGSSFTYINNVLVQSGASQTLNAGDILQFSNKKELKYVFSFALKEEHPSKKRMIDLQILDSVLTEQKTFSEGQAYQKRELKDKLQTKQQEQEKLKQQLSDLLRQQNDSDKDKEVLRGQILILEGRIETGNNQEQQLRNVYSELLVKLENERVQFEARLNEEKQKWQAALDLSKQEKESLELRMKDQMEKWNLEQQTEWRKWMAEKTVLEERLKETEKALKEREAKAEPALFSGIHNALGPDVPGTAQSTAGNCILWKIADEQESSGYHILDIIDLDIKETEGVLNKVSDLMDEQLTCSICSELFVKATTLKCMHTFCRHCIVTWTRTRKECPMCRAPVSTMQGSLVLDNFIDGMVENLPADVKDRRLGLIQERKTVHRKRK